MDMDSYLKFILFNFSFENIYQADRVLKKHYETVFEIFDHRPKSTKGKRPWSGMAALENNIPEKDPLPNLIDEFYQSGILKVLGMTFLEYIQLPRTVAEGLREDRKSVV